MSLDKLKGLVRKVCELEIGDITDVVRTVREQLSTLAEFESFASPDGETSESVPYKDGRVLSVIYGEKEDLEPLFGRARRYEISENGVTRRREEAHVRKDLPERVKKFVRSHELYHLIDESRDCSWARGELRANLVPGLRDPFGLLATIKATLEDRQRVQMYLNRIRNSIQG